MRLQAKKITKKFGEQTALDGVDLTIEDGEFFGLLGSNGAGKTTMIRIISTLMLPTSGEIVADGQSLTRSNIELKKKITVMTQEYTLRNDMTIEEIIEYQGRLYRVPKKERRERSGELMQLVGLYEHRKKLVRHLSGGMKRKVMLCRALLPKPELILLDEPTVGLDPVFRHQMWEILRKLNQQGVGFLLTTHYLEEAQQLCKRVAFLNQGKIVESGSPQQIVNELGAFCVEHLGETHLFKEQDEAIAYLQTCSSQANLRDTNLEDVFFHLSGGKK